MTLRTLEKTKSDLNIGISQHNREGVVKILNTLLADGISCILKQEIIIGM